MKQLLLAMNLLLFFTISAQAAANWTGKVETATGFFFSQGWESCEIQILNQTQDEIRFQYSLKATQPVGQSQTRILTLKKTKNSGVSYEFYDYNYSDPSQKISESNLEEKWNFRLKSISDNTQLKFKITYSVDDIGRQIERRNLICILDPK